MATSAVSSASVPSSSTWSCDKVNELSENEPFIPRHLRRYVHIGVASGLLVMLIGCLIFRDSDAGLQAAWGVGSLTMFAVFHFLDERHQARERREGKEPQ